MRQPPFPDAATLLRILLIESINWIEAQEREELKHEQLLNRLLVLEDDDSKIDDDQLLKEEELEERINSDDNEKELIFDF